MTWPGRVKKNVNTQFQCEGLMLKINKPFYGIGCWTFLKDLPSLGVLSIFWEA